MQQYLKGQKLSKGDSVSMRVTLYHAWRIIMAESFKQNSGFWNSPSTYFSMLIWPLLELATVYYTFQPIAFSPHLSEHWALAKHPGAILLFFTTGILGVMFFRSLVNAAWQFSLERFQGTLEAIFLTPANRLVVVIANGGTALLQNVWLFLIFSIALIALVGSVRIAYPAMLLIAFLSLLIPAIAWATFLNSFFIFVRDPSILHVIFQEPMTFFSGAFFPTFTMPFVMQTIGLIFPLTTSLFILRGIILYGATVVDLWPQLLFLLGLSALLIAFAAWLLALGERRARYNGSLTQF